MRMQTAAGTVISAMSRRTVRQNDRWLQAYGVAASLAGLGEKDEAFAWLEKAYQQREYELTLLRVSPAMDNLRSDPRFTDLLRRVGLAQ